MAAETVIEQLPFGVLECIVDYLSDKDLSKCCAVSTSWYEVFSNDKFWKKHCNIELSVYLESANCLVEPYFITTDIEDSNLSPVKGWRLCFLREQHYLKNFRSGRYKRKEIEFDFDDSIRYDIKVESVANDYVFLHMTFETQVWNVAQEPLLVMNIPFQLVELWENNLYKFHENNLIIVQCNVVQLFKICLPSKTWNFHCTFFFDKPEEFSLNISEDTDVNKMFKNTSYEVGDSVLRVICDNFFIGMVTTKEALQNPVMHIWDLNSCKKIKEENLSEYFDSGVSRLFFSESQNKVTITFHKDQEEKECFIVYSLAKLKFLASYECRMGDSLLCGGYLCIRDFSKGILVRLDLDTNVVDYLFMLPQTRVDLWCVICRKILFSNFNDIILVNPKSKTVKIQSCGDFGLGRMVEVVKDKYLVLQDQEGNLREIHEYMDKSNRNEGNIFKKMFQLPSDSGIYRTTNVVCTKMVLERANKLIVLNFW